MCEVYLVTESRILYRAGVPESGQADWGTRWAGRALRIPSTRALHSRPDLTRGRSL